MKEIERKFKDVVGQFRLVSGSKFHETVLIQFLKSLNTLERKKYEQFINDLIANKILVKDEEGDCCLTDCGELFVYGENNDPTVKILNELFMKGFAEGSCWQFACYNSFSNNLNPVEHKYFVNAINKLIVDGILEKDEFENLVLTKKGEEKICKLFD